MEVNKENNEPSTIYKNNLNYTGTGLFKNCIGMPNVICEIENNFAHVVTKVLRFREFGKLPNTLDRTN